MTLQGYLSLAVQTVTAPRDVARLLLSLNLSREALATAFALVCVLSAAFYALSLTGFTGAPAPVLAMPPAVFLALQAATLAGTIVALTWAGRGMGGTAAVQDIAVLMIWLQALRLLLQLAMLLIVPLSSMLGGLAFFAATAAAVWIAVHFVAAAHGFDNLLRALATLVLGVVGMAIALSILLALLGVAPNGTMTNV